MAKSKYPRKHTDLFNRYQVIIVGTPRSKNHIVYPLETPKGNRFSFTMSKTASDHRAMKNAESTLRKLIQQHDNEKRDQQ